MSISQSNAFDENDQNNSLLKSCLTSNISEDKLSNEDEKNQKESSPIKNFCDTINEDQEIVVKEEDINDKLDNERDEGKKNPLNLMSLSKDVPYAVGLLPNKNEKLDRKTKAKRRCTRSFNKENSIENVE